MHKLTFTLKQHTPLIHFQHDQHGATLRATELKPKLDRFLISLENLTELANEQEVPKEEYKSYFINNGKTHLALDYKVRIVDTIEKDGYPFDIPEGYPLFFGNMDQHGRDRKFLTFSTDLTIEVFSFKTELLDCVDNHIHKFFLYHNFGSRQSKGFGSFSLDMVPQVNDFDLSFYLNLDDKNDYILTKSIKNSRVNNEIRNFTRLFAQIDIFYKSLRSGINRKGGDDKSKFYIKPVIFHYAKDRLRKQWDKKSIKERYLTEEEYPELSINEQIEKHDYSDVLTYSSNEEPHLLLKDLFGLSTVENWKKYDAIVTKTNAEALRFASPLLIKPIQMSENQYFVGLKFKDIDNGFFDKTFEVEFGQQTGLELKTPESFSWNDFITYMKNDLPSLRSRCKSSEKLTSQPEYWILKNIYEQIS
ncbi:hypothetical protein EMN47_10735 [Prolixibacteraceae bacterium JC049]|nr:hypothetical protein [Prolixibacteraceae bacterium JC049]